MDGYALRAADVPEQGGYLVLAGRIAAGHSSDELLQAGQTVRIFTGAPLPPGADSVVPQERCRVYGQRIWCPPLRLGEHVRKRGEENAARATALLRVGQRLRAPGSRPAGVGRHSVGQGLSPLARVPAEQRR